MPGSYIPQIVSATLTSSTNIIMRDRINEVCSLKAGWLDGVEGEAIECIPDQVQLVAETIAIKLDMLPGIFPTPEGYISLEWMLDDDTTLEIIVR